MELWIWTWRIFFLALVLSLLDSVLPQLRYTVHEELEHGAFVGNIAEDLGLDANKLSTRRFRTVSASKKQYLEVNLENGVLFVNDRIDREQLCEQSPYCSFHLQVVIENPLELYIVEVEILDVNDNSPSFPWGEFNLDISESAIPGSRFSLESAQDLDVGDNSLRSYLLSVNEHFVLDIQTRSDGSKFAELILESPLDREQQKTHQMVLTAVDGGLPERSSTTQINIVVLDANDNAPVFDQNFYKVRLVENVPEGTVVIKLNASDLDEGSNGEIAYTFSGHAPMKVRELFTVDSLTGEIKVKGLVDYEKARMHEIYVQAKDKGPSAVAVHCRVLVSVVDVNDNLPEVILTSVSTPVREDAPPGTVIAVISVMDPDSGENGNVHCEIPHHVPFQLYSPFKNHYTLVTNDFLDRETVSEYNVTITARDMGSPPLFTKKSLLVQVYDINDNVPWFKQPSYTVYLTENNAPGASVFTVTAQDADVDQNSYLSYSILESVIQAMPVSTYMSINSDNGNIYALRSFDHEELRSFNMVIQAEDAGFPSLCANVTVNVFILDQNDNAPVIISPLSENGTVATEAVPRSADVGYLVAQITATDADEGQNSRLFYQVMQATDPSLFSVGLYTGEIRTIRRMVEKDPTRHRLVIMLKDNGQPPLSATTSIILSVVDSVPKSVPDFDDLSLSPQYWGNLTLYLIVSLGAVAFTFLVAIIVLVTIKGYRDRHFFHGCNLSVSSCCGFRYEAPTTEAFKNSNLNVHISSGSKRPTNFVEMNGNTQVTQKYCYKMCLTPASSKSDFTFLKPCSPEITTTRNNTTRPDNGSFTWSSSSRALDTNYVGASPSGIRRANKDWTLMKTQRKYAHKRPASTGETLKVLCRETVDNVDTSIYEAVPEYWTWRSNDSSDSTQVGVFPYLSWTPWYGHPDTSHLLSDYQHNVHIPGTPSTLCKLQLANNGDLDVYNSFSTFGKNKKFISKYDQHDDTVTTNDLYK
ncbi:protocadherin-10 [Electrophorus electricus]|uniref:protocadherin-10 n=1 Tax=Electrophorus electricus TaxID=8005 RepID=UPI0015D081DC|nr:protocadherin-10 [Electrophorus electricus]